MEGTIGTIILFGGNFAPRSWAFCQGQLLAIASNDALFSILGTTYGGDGRTTFGLPDLRGRAPIGTGSGPGLPPVQLGAKGGSSAVTLTANNLPSHTHTATTTVGVSSQNASSEEPAGNVLAAQPGNVFSAASTANGNMGAVATTVANTGGGQSFDNHQPYLGLEFVICLQGVYPSRS